MSKFQEFFTGRNITVMIFMGAMIATIVMVFVWDIQRVIDKDYNEETVCGEDPGGVAGNSDHKKAYDKCMEYRPRTTWAYVRMGAAGLAGIGLLGYIISRNKLKKESARF